MPSTTDDLHIEAINALRSSADAGRTGTLVSLPHVFSRSPKPSTPATRTANVYPFASAIHNDSQLAPATVGPMAILHIWWSRWLERHRFGRALPWLADEVLEDYGLTREEARKLCRRPFWRP